MCKALGFNNMHNFISYINLSFESTTTYFSLLTESVDEKCSRVEQSFCSFCSCSMPAILLSMLSLMTDSGVLDRNLASSLVLLELEMVSSEPVFDPCNDIRSNHFEVVRFLYEMSLIIENIRIRI